MEDGGGVGGVVEASSLDQPGQDGADVQAPRLGFPHRCQERPERRAFPHRSEGRSPRPQPVNISSKRWRWASWAIVVYSLAGTAQLSACRAALSCTSWADRSAPGSGQDADQDVPWALTYGQLFMGGSRVGVISRVHVQPVSLVAPGGGHVKGRPGRGGRDKGVGGLHSGALGPASSVGVRKLHVVGHILIRQDHLAVAVEAPEGPAAIFVGGCDRPAGLRSG